MDVILDGTTAKSRGLQLAERPERPTAEKKYETTSVPGRDGDLHEFVGYDDVEEIIKLNYIVGTSVKAKMRQDTPWLLSRKKLVYSDDPTVYREIKTAQILPAINDLPQYAQFEVVYTCAPFWFEEAGTETITAGGTIENPGATSVKPVIELFGAGELSITVNGIKTTVKNVVGSVTIDGISENLTKNGVEVNKDLVGPFPVLKEGSNTITLTGATKAEIQKRWQWL